MSYLFSAIRDYVLPSATNTTEDSTPSNNNSTTETAQKNVAPTKDTLAPTAASAASSAPHPYAANANSNQNRILVLSASNTTNRNTLAIPAVSLNSVQPPTIITNSSDSNSDSELDSENDSEVKIATPYLATTTTNTPFMTLSTADDPDGMIPPSHPCPSNLAALCYWLR